MNMNIFNKFSAEALIFRVNQLTPAARPIWGVMNVTEMLLHCNICNKQILEAPVTVKQPTTLKQFMLRILALYVAPDFQKNRKGDERNDTVGKVSPDRFMAEKSKFIELITSLSTHKGNITLPHIAFGNLSTNQWGIAIWKHMDHHLRQFGV